MWYKLAKSEFNYDQELKDLWRTLISAEMDRVNIYFDLENNDVVKSRTIDIDFSRSDNSAEYKVYAELYQAGGDWQCPNYYFRCQIMDRHNHRQKSRGKFYLGDKFVFIPAKNLNLTKDKDGNRHATDNNESECIYIGDKGSIKEYDLWEAVKKETKRRLKDYYSQEGWESDSWKSGLVTNLLQKFDR